MSPPPLYLITQSSYLQFFTWRLIIHTKLMTDSSPQCRYIFFISTLYSRHSVTQDVKYKAFTTTITKADFQVFSFLSLYLFNHSSIYVCLHICNRLVKTTIYHEFLPLATTITTQTAVPRHICREEWEMF